MLTRRPDYNKRFHCLGGACPDTCCRDWDIVLDGGAVEDYRAAPEPLREKIAAALTVDEDGDTCFRLREDGFCALLTEDGLCPIQRDWGEAHLCAHCEAYPRFTEEYGPLTETALAVSCPEAARLLLEVEEFTLEETDDGVARPPLPGVDGVLLAGLEHSRRAALEQLKKPDRPLWDRLAGLLAYAGDLQDCIDFGAYDSMAERAPEPEEGGGTARDRRILTARFMELCAGLEPLRPAWPALLTRRAGELRALSDGDYAGLCAQYERACPDWQRRLTNLCCYLVFRHWHKTVNDDGLYGRAALVCASALLLYHLELLAWRAGAGENPIPLWSAFSREIEHMDENLDFLIETLFDGETWPLA